MQGERDGKGGTSACHYESMTEQINTFRSTNKYHGKLTGVNLVFQCCNNGQYPQVILFIYAVKRDKDNIYIYILAWTIMHRQRIYKLYAICI